MPLLYGPVQCIASAISLLWVSAKRLSSIRSTGEIRWFSTPTWYHYDGTGSWSGIRKGQIIFCICCFPGPHFKLPWGQNSRSTLLTTNLDIKTPKVFVRFREINLPTRSWDESWYVEHCVRVMLGRVLNPMSANIWQNNRWIPIIKGPVMWKAFPCDDVITFCSNAGLSGSVMLIIYGT